MFKRTMEKLAGWIDRENAVTSLNTAEPKEEHVNSYDYATLVDRANKQLTSMSDLKPPSLPLRTTDNSTVEPDWKAIAEEMYDGICRALAEPPGDTRALIKAATKYESAKQVKP